MHFFPASDQSILVYLGEEIGLPAHARVLQLLRTLEHNSPPWLRNLQPAYTSLMISFDPSLADHAVVESLVLGCAHSPTTTMRKPRTVEIPACYGGEFGPDLQEVAALHRLTPTMVIQLHSSQTYRAYFLGFAPGFAYLGDVPDAIATPRLETPRKKIPAGSVAIAGKQTAVYPFATPGGWRILGRTPLPMFRQDQKRLSAISIGDSVRFKPISTEEFLRMES